MANKIRGKVESSNLKEYQGILQIGFKLEQGIWYNLDGEEDILKEVQELVSKGNEIEFDYDPEKKKVSNLMVISKGNISKSDISEDKKEEKDKKEENFGEFKSNEVVDIKGKKHVIYQGLLRLAHEKGLMNFEILEKYVSDDMKKSWCLVRAHCKKDKKDVFFDGIGSSTPDNTGSMTESHPVEMANTRAKGRALRDFLNIGQAMFEELKE